MPSKGRFMIDGNRVPFRTSVRTAAGFVSGNQAATLLDNGFTRLAATRARAP